MRRLVNKLAIERGEWSGYPIPDDALELVVEPTHPLYKSLNGAKLDSREGPTDESLEMVAKAFGDCDSIFPINCWVARDGREVWVYHNGDGRSKVATIPDRTAETRLHFALNTLVACLNWEPAAESTAQQCLFGMISEHQQRTYVVGGAFAETSKRSGVTYIFRRGRPTLAVKLDPDGGCNRLLAALCLHPIAYYKDSFAGAMVPSDEVIAHLSLMRGDEKMFWRKANHHSADSAACGL